METHFFTLSSTIAGLIIAIIAIYIMYRIKNGVKQKVVNHMIHTYGLYEGKVVYSERDHIKTATIEMLRQRRLDAKTAIRQAEINSIDEMIMKDDAKKLIRQSKKRK